MRSLLALPALLCALVVAVPSPAAYEQHPLEDYVPASVPRASRWSSISAHFMKSIFGFEEVKQSRISFPDRNSKDRHTPKHAYTRYGEDLVLRFNVSSHEEAASLAEAADTLLLDVWEFAKNWVDIRLSKETVPLLLGLLPASLQHAHRPLLREQELAKAIVNNYQKHRDKPETSEAVPYPTRRPFSPTLDPSAQAETNIFFADYQPFSVIEPWLRLLASLFTTHVRHLNIGLTYEGRNIPGLRIGVHPTNSEDPGQPKRKTILIVGSLHAREWISTTTVNYIAYSLITGYGKVPSVTKLLEAFDFVLIPTLNPDGYVYTWETDRLWRKNRQQTGIRFCQGIDLDRSFGFEWSATDNPCSESFSGESPFDAVEAKAFADWAKNETENNNVEFAGFLDLHSYSQEILYPYSYSCDDSPPGLENLEELAYGLGRAIRVTHNHNYEVMPACEGNVMYTAGSKKEHLSPRMEESGGSALDFFYRTMGVRYAYQVKLRDRGTYGFLLPRDNIIPTGKEILNAVLYFGGFLSELYDLGESEVELIKPVLESEEITPAESAVEMNGLGDDEPWVTIEDLGEDDGATKWDLRRRRRR
ncbi:putative metallocarboxypeptidase ECM14 [Pseudocercospora fuligena]|uniref:Inactive metallocarboxypeptidase ECM14 n=1 Tax=Pseudocercospora fuligena TaxID=685502 RepID=A0A8H6REH2_9PEZI|nr:putative metallocarboxypeptidase ECM14 [Pseudocercospora fuligena]